MTAKPSFILWFSEVDKDDIGIVGSIGANLGEMSHAGLPISPGFIISTYAYFQFIRENNLAPKIKDLLGTADFERPDSLMQVSSHIKRHIMHAKMSDYLVQEIAASYEKLGGILHNSLVAVRSSATAEDIPNASFAGQQETYLNISGEANLVLTVKQAWASLFEARAIVSRHKQHYDHFRIGTAVVIQKMIEAEKSGVMFTNDPVSKDKSKIIIEAINGLGELLMQAEVAPDRYEVTKKDLSIIKKRIEKQDVMLKKVGSITKTVKIPEDEGIRQKLTKNQILDLAILGKKIEWHYYFPQDIAWAIEKNEIFIVQTRAISAIQGEKRKQPLKPSRKLPLILKGSPASPGIASGTVKLIQNKSDLKKILPGDILVAEQTTADYIPAMKKATAIITDKGSRTSHAAIVSRELGIPAVVGTNEATQLLKNGTVITINGTAGEVYKGGLTTVTHHMTNEEPEVIKTATRVYVNLAQSAFAEKVAKEHVDGVGLLRAEFIMAELGVHPKKMIRDGKRTEYINALADQLEIFCHAFTPRPIVYRVADFKTNEYRDLTGGADYEQIESNPLIGFRGAYRSIHEHEVFALELEAIKKVREKKNLKNLWLMLPFVRTVHELKEVKKIITRAGLHRSPTFKLWMMVEVPANVILLDQFIEAGIDGVSIGSNDLTMLILGTDRDNSEVATAFDELNPAVLWAIERTIKTAHKYHITSSICGQAPSLHPSLLEKLVEWGITSVSVSSDAIGRVRRDISRFERELIESRYNPKK